MKLLSWILASALGLGSVPAQAQVLGRVSLQTTVSAPAPAAGFLPAAAFIPAMPAALSAPLVSALPAPAAPIAAPARRASPLEALRGAAVPDLSPRADSAFDGSFARSAAASAEPPSVPGSEAKPRATPLERYRLARNKYPLQNTFGKALIIADLSAVSLPILWGAAPAFKITYALPYAILLIAGVVLPIVSGLALQRKLKPARSEPKPPSRRSKLAAAAAGVILGVGLAMTPYLATGPSVQRIEGYLDGGRSAADQKNTRWIQGGAVEDETIKILSKNPVGQEILDELRDRGGVIRLPTFFVSRQFDAVASHDHLYDGVYLEQDQITGRGWTVEEFLRDPALQRQLIRDMASTILHELVHGVQGRRPPWKTGFSKSSLEEEQEAWLYQTLYLIANLEQASGIAMVDPGHQWMVIEAAASLVRFVDGIGGMYPGRPLVGDPYFKAFFAAQNARWPAYRVHIYQVLAARARFEAMAKTYMDKAKDAAEEAGLPEPKPITLPK